MKNLVIILIALLVFFGCLWVGFQAAGEVLPVGKNTPLAPVASNDRQQNIFLIHVDQLKSGQPRLISTWILFLYYSDAPSMTFKPIYEQDGSVPHPAPLNALFSVGEDGSPSPQFLKALRDNASSLPIEGYIILDDQALASIVAHFPGDGPSPEPFQVVTPTEHQAIEQMCGYFPRAPSRTTKGVDLPWNEIIPDHFRTDINFTSFMSNWGRLTRAPQPPHCEILGAP